MRDMAVFNEYEPIIKQWFTVDRQRHKELVEESVKKSIGNILSQECIIGVDGNKKIKIPVRGIKEYSFVFSRTVPHVATGDGDEIRGDVIGEDIGLEGAGAYAPGQLAADEIYEMEITVDELAQHLFERFSLPKLHEGEKTGRSTDMNIRNPGYRKKGIPPRLSKKMSVIQKIKRNQSYKRSSEQERSGITQTRFPFIKEDLRYRRANKSQKNGCNAVVICIMDVSGSMDQVKKYLARSFYFILYNLVKSKYPNIEVVFLAHTTTAKEVDEPDFFHRGESGGTYISSGYKKALEIIDQRYNPQYWNIYTFHCSDGDNWTEDNKKAVRFASRLCEVCKLFGYGEISPDFAYKTNTLKEEFIKNISAENLVIISMSDKDGIEKGLKSIFEKDEVLGLEGIAEDRGCRITT